MGCTMAEQSENVNVVAHEFVTTDEVGGPPIGPNNLLIAAAARVHGLTPVTHATSRRIEHFLSALLSPVYPEPYDAFTEDRSRGMRPT